jgi:hypothetical protein
MNDKNKLWREWWTNTHGKNAPAGSYNKNEGHMWEAWNAGWDAAHEKSQVEINHLKEQLMRANTNDGAYKAAFLAGQMTARGGSWK